MEQFKISCKLEVQEQSIIPKKKNNRSSFRYYSYLIKSWNRVATVPEYINHLFLEDIIDLGKPTIVLIKNYHIKIGVSKSGKSQDG